MRVFSCEILNHLLHATRTQIMEPPLTMRQRLECWRKQTGPPPCTPPLISQIPPNGPENENQAESGGVKFRTPMKRLSYVCEYEGHKHPQQQQHHSSMPLHKKLVSTAPRSRNPSDTKEGKVLLPLRENTDCHSNSLEAVKPQLSRREKLEQWISIHGSTVKRARSYRPGHVSGRRVENQSPRRKLPKRRHTISARPASGGSYSEENRCRAALREQFQRDIDDTVAEILQNVGCSDRMAVGGEGVDPLSVQLDFDSEAASSEWEGEERSRCQRSINHSGCTPTGRNKRQSNGHLKAGQVFQSSTIRYSMALSEPRKRRHLRATPDANQKRKLHLTPVRRSTRKNRQGPGMDLDKTLCFDSPSEARFTGEFEGIEIVPNKALA